jgi:hypothetical protein
VRVGGLGHDGVVELIFPIARERHAGGDLAGHGVGAAAASGGDHRVAGRQVLGGADRHHRHVQRR